MWFQPILKRMERGGHLFSMVIPLDKSVGLIQKIPPEKAWKPACQSKRRRKGCYLFQQRPVKDTQPVCTCSVGSWNSSPHYGRTMLIPGLCVFRPALTKSWHAQPRHVFLSEVCESQAYFMIIYFSCVQGKHTWLHSNAQAVGSSLPTCSFTDFIQLSAKSHISMQSMPLLDITWIFNALRDPLGL